MNIPTCRLISPKRSIDCRPDRGNSISLFELQVAVGGHIQIVPLTEELIMVCNEDGIALKLPINPAAMRQVEQLTGHGGVPIYGNVLICEKGMVE